MFTGSHLRAVTDADDDDDDDNAGRHSTTTRATYRQRIGLSAAIGLSASLSVIIGR